MYLKTMGEKLIFIIGLITFPLIVAGICLGVGRFSLSLFDGIKILYSIITSGKESVAANEYSVLINMRLPRIILAMICGGGLAVAGVGLQAVFSNPLVSPDTLGVASGASFGAALALLFRSNMITVQFSALCFGLLACFLTYILADIRGAKKTIMLILSGLVISSLFQAMVSLAKYVADTEEILPSITYWLMGSLYTSNYKSIILGTPSILIAVSILLLIRWKMNVLSLTEDEAKSLGMNIRYMRMTVIICSAMITSSVVSMCGQIGWVGLLIPHICRMLFGSDTSKVIPASISIGATFLLLVDTLSRSVAVTEIPVSILTAVIGAPLFLSLLRRAGNSL